MTAARAPVPETRERVSISTEARAQLPAVIDRGPFGSVVPICAGSKAAEGEIQRAYASLFEWAPFAVRAYSAQTRQAWRRDWLAFSRFCLRRGLQPLPATVTTVCAFMAWRIELGNKPATIVRAISTIALVHRAAGVINPCESEKVQLSKRAMYRELGARQDQARGFVWSEIERFLALPILTLRDHRDRALIAAAYDSMCRSEEIVRVDLEDIDWMADGSGVILVRSSKTDPEGQGALTYLSPLTAKLLKKWLISSGIKSGAVFRTVEGKSMLGARLKPAALGERIRRAGQWIGLAQEEWQKLSGHSCRVGATQDFFAANFQLPAVMQQGRWKDARMPARYGERILASRGAMAQLAQQQGRI